MTVNHNQKVSNTFWATMKTCTKCKIEKELDQFAKHKGKKDGLQTRCRQCSSEIDKIRYAEGRIVKGEDYKQKSKDMRIRNGQYIYDYLKNHPCIDCGESNPIVLEFDHRDNSGKKYVISTMTSYALTTIDKEIAKCDVRCANCHRIRTAIQLGWYKNIVK